MNHPQKPELGKREVTFSREIYVEQDDFMEDPPKKFFRLGPGREVRLRAAYLVTCKEVVRGGGGKCDGGGVGKGYGDGENSR